MRYPKMRPTDEQRRTVERLARDRIPQVEIAKRLSMARSTLRRYFAAELKLSEQVGRPSIETTDEQREEVTILVAAGFKQESIALRFGISPDTLQLRFADEIANGYDLRRQDAIIALYRKAVGTDAAPNAAAIEKFLKRVDMLPTPLARSSVRRAAAPGKKEQALADAATAVEGTSWAELLSDKSAAN